MGVAAVTYFIFICTFLRLLLHCDAQTGSNYRIIYQFGDSMSDTGNYILESPIGASSPYTRLPYGETYFKKPTGRASDGRLTVDFLAQELGIPLLKPYLKRDFSHFHHGVNFAVSGATALDTDFLDRYYNNTVAVATRSSLNVQLKWFFSYLDYMCFNQTECDEKVRTALFVVGEIGFNDCGYPFFTGKSINEVKPVVPHVVKTIKYVVKKLISHGATRLIVPGIFPMGCFPAFLTLFKNNDSSYYDDAKCLKDFNDFTKYHNKYLEAELTRLSRENPGVIILYADYYNAFQWTIRNSGIEKEYVLKACCGNGGVYNVDLRKLCGDDTVSLCPNPSKYISWDGAHFTEMGFKLMFKWILKNNLFSLKI